MKISALVFLMLLFISCKNDTEKDLAAQEVVDRSIAVSGGENYLKKNTSFVFRNMIFRSKVEMGKKVLEREQTSDSLIIKDVLVSSHLRRYHNDNLIQLQDSMAAKYANSVNSVHYFARLPFGLNDQAVRKELLGEVKLNGQEYYKVKVTFTQENGGVDFEDVFLYWFNKKSFKPDFLAYEYQTDGGGQRFRKAFNERYVNGIRFVDYQNFKPRKKTVDLVKIDSLFENGGLELLSTVQLKNIHVFDVTD